MSLRWIGFVLLFGILTLTACGPGGGDAAGVGPGPGLVPYPTATPTPTRDPARDLPPPPPPTPTPVTYTVVAGDTLSAIAARFNVTLKDLLDANPGVGTQVLQVGQVLTIPLGSPALAGQPTPTPVPLTTGAPVCYPTADGGLWCLAAVTNTYGDRIENLTARMDLLDGEDRTLASAPAMFPLDLLPPAGSLAFLAFFPPGQVPATAFHPRLALLTATRLLPTDARYLDVEILNLLVEMPAGGLTARVSGRLRLTGKLDAGQVWVAAIAYDVTGRPVGVRRWESARGLEAGESLEFAFDLYSLGPAIERVEVVAQARP